MKIKLITNGKVVQDTAQGVGKTANEQFKLNLLDISSAEDINYAKKILDIISIESGYPKP